MILFGNLDKVPDIDTTGLIFNFTMRNPGKKTKIIEIKFPYLILAHRKRDSLENILISSSKAM